MIETIRAYFGFCPEPYRKKLRESLVLGILMGFCRGLRIPAIYVMMLGVNAGNVTGWQVLASLALVAGGVVGEGLLRGRATTLQCEAGYFTATEKRIEIAQHLRYLPMGYFTRGGLGTIASVATNTMDQLQDVATRIVMLVSEGLLNTALVAIFLLFFDWRVSLTLIAGSTLYLLANRTLQHRSRASSAEKVSSDDELVAQILQYLQGMQEVKAYGLVGEKSATLNAAIARNVDANTGMEVALVPWMAVQRALSKLTTVAMSAVSIVLFLRGSMDLPLCITMIASSFMVLGSLESAGNYSGLLRVIKLCIEKVDAVLATEQMDVEGEDVRPAAHDIAMQDVRFSYEDRPIVNGVTLKAPDGQAIALVGPSGAGKTTLARLMARFWDVDEGAVELGGVNVRSWSMASLMPNYSFVFQNVYLFSDTIENNIRFGRPGATHDEVVDAARRACCDGFIRALPDGYDTVVGEGGHTLSGGERQRISIARAIMKDAPVVILDEATANVDPENEAELTAALDELTREKTVIKIAHRLKTVRDAGRIYVIDHGQVVEEGTHEELAARNGIYRRFIDARTEAAGWRL